MKTLKKLLPFVVIGLVLTGCGSQSNSSQGNSSMKPSSSSQSSSVSSSNSSNSDASSSSNSSNSNNAKSSSQNSSKSDSQSDKASMKPSNKTNEAKSAKKAKQASFVATQKYASASEAEKQINYQGDMGGQPVNLGYNIKGTQDNGAGQVYVHFNMGDWSITVHGNNVSTNGNSKALPTAKKAVKYLQTHTLPYPNKRGSILLQSDSTEGASSVKWQDSKLVNTITGNPSNVLKKAVSVSK
ncbi:hypothetical protein WR164_00340 [Philodulcilactobacillus myokoensis]|uniref:Lipoprotein n=1 Tax=Philodulcilactobacillus myokoensis TaxID=2929573 RepID=A0A9W6ERA5_9LACO|nr:hypothetical protein [Philodulcilactobacillus myokoensis]GLB46055.1 hypothetical protein WR164_00340 [Philodulcilactobacillus myokoensis]